LSDLTDSRIKIIVQKRIGSLERDDKVENSIQTYWKRRFCDMAVALATLDAMIYPLGFLQTGWDMRAEQGQGEVIFKHRDPVSVFPDPDAEDDDGLRYFVLEDILDIVQIRRDWPETGWRVDPDAAYSSKSGDQKGTRPSFRAGSGYTGPLYTKVGMSGVPGWQKARAGVLTCVVDDDELKEEIQEIGGQ